MSVRLLVGLQVDNAKFWLMQIRVEALQLQPSHIAAPAHPHTALAHPQYWPFPASDCLSNLVSLKKKLKNQFYKSFEGLELTVLTYLGGLMFVVAPTGKGGLAAVIDVVVVADAVAVVVVVIVVVVN